MSPRKFSGRSEVLTYRQHFGRRWQRFVRAHFEDPIDCAHFFKVDVSTASNWWEGLNSPQGWVIGRALADPDLGPAAFDHLRVAA